MAVIPIEYPERLRSPDEAAALYRRLGEARVAVRGFRTNEPRRISSLVEAIEPGREAAIHVEAGLLDERGWERLGALAAARPAYLDLHAGPANLRVSPAQLKVYARLPVDGVLGVSEAFGAPLRAGANQCGETTIAIDPVVGYPLAVAVATTDLAVALRMFRALGDPQVARGHVAGPTPAAKAALAPLLHGLRGTVHVAFDVALEVARALAAELPDLAHDWRAQEVCVELPSGRVRGFLKPPHAGEHERARWLARVRDAAPR